MRGTVKERRAQGAGEWGREVLAIFQIVKAPPFVFFFGVGRVTREIGWQPALYKTPRHPANAGRTAKRRRGMI